MISRSINLSLRLVTLASRFLFLFVLARFLEPSDVGLYGLFTATVGYAIYFVGLDFYTYVTRELIAAPNSQRGRAIKSQVLLSLLLYAVFIPAGVVAIYGLRLPSTMFVWFLPILALEHINQEIHRLLVALSRQAIAGVVLFTRQGAWAIGIAGLWLANPKMAELYQVFMAWLLAGVVAAILGVWAIRQEKMGGWDLRIDWTWIWRGVRVSAGFLIATLALRGMQTIDRYWLEALSNLDIVGAYVLFLGIAGTLLAFLDAGLFSYAYPRLVLLTQNSDLWELKASMRRLLLFTVLWSVVFCVIAVVTTPVLIEWIGKDAYLEQSNLLFWILAATVLNAIGLVPHYGLYALGNDRPIIFSHIAGLVAFFVAVFPAAPVLGPVAIPLALVAGFAVIAVWKSAAYLKIKPLGNA